ncbi:hypothetical protein [Comamonas sp. 26]|uniref:hypothetical protein n=1 Tax=Comamonas sp. 26 TaxID=2035201 RepID=UPI00130411F6|nr:hypothetical protein [Comamonas sp. 26]
MKAEIAPIWCYHKCEAVKISLARFAQSKLMPRVLRTFCDTLMKNPSPETQALNI